MIVLTVFLLSVWIFSYLLFRAAQQVIPINAIDRLPTRLLLYPLFVLLVLACVGWEKSGMVKRIQKNVPLQFLLIISFVLPVLYNSYHWSASEVSSGSKILENTLRNTKPVFDTKILDAIDPAYVRTVNVSLLVSLVSLLAIVGVYVSLQKKMSENGYR